MNPKELAQALRAKAVASAPVVPEAVWEQTVRRPAAAPTGVPTTAHRTLADLLDEVFGTRFVPMSVLRDAFASYLIKVGHPSSTVEIVAQPSPTAVTRLRGGYLKIWPAVFAAGPTQRHLFNRSEPIVFLGAVPVDGIYSAWYDDCANSLLVGQSQGAELGRALYEAGLKHPDEIEASSAAHKMYGSRGVVRGARVPEAPKTFVWRWHTYDVWGDGKKNAWDVNEVRRTPEVLEIGEAMFSFPEREWTRVILHAMREIEVFNRGATVATVRIERDDESSLRFVRIRDSRPVGELRREHEIFPEDED